MHRLPVASCDGLWSRDFRWIWYRFGSAGIDSFHQVFIWWLSAVYRTSVVGKWFKLKHRPGEVWGATTAFGCMCLEFMLWFFWKHLLDFGEKQIEWRTKCSENLRFSVPDCARSSRTSKIYNQFISVHHLTSPILPHYLIAFDYIQHCTYYILAMLYMYVHVSWVVWMFDVRGT